MRGWANTQRPRVAGVLSLEEGLRLVASQTASPEEFVQLASTVDFQVAQRTLVCSLSGEALSSEELLDTAYWSRQAAEPAKLKRAVDTLAELGCLVLLELGSQSPLSGLVSTGWPGEVAPTLIASLSEDGAASLFARLGSLAQLYMSMASRRISRPLMLPGLVASCRCRPIRSSGSGIGSM